VPALDGEEWSQMNRACSYCGSAETEWLNEEELWRCRSCQRSILSEADSVDAPPPSQHAAPDAPPPRSKDFTRLRGAPGEVGSLAAAGLGLAFTILFYLAIQLVPDSMFYELFARRGWVPYVIMGTSSWALFLLGAKLRRLRQEAQILDRELIQTPLPGRLRPCDAEVVLQRLTSLSGPAGESFLVARLIRALRHFEARRRVVEVVEHLASESRADDLRVDASYGLVRVFVWAVPTLGFIGTVIGIGAAVGGFSDTLAAASSLESMKESIGAVTGGLGVAFDTTLLALVMSMLIMFPANAVQRIEEALLGRVDDYCTEHLVQRLEDEEVPDAEADLIEALAARLLAAMRSDERR
jgi:MotA/TolQ/ExbB proton channel family